MPDSRRKGISTVPAIPLSRYTAKSTNGWFRKAPSVSTLRKIQKMVPVLDKTILKEIDEIRKKNSDIEDRMLEQLETIESTEASVKSKEAELAGFVQSYREKKETFAAKEKRERQSVEALNEKKARISANADPQIITVLDDVKKKVRGLAVVPVQQAICMGCHMNIPAQLFNELQRFDELRFCPHCHRIIYWKEQG